MPRSWRWPTGYGALAGSWAGIWALYATYTWTAAAGLEDIMAENDDI